MTNLVGIVRVSVSDRRGGGWGAYNRLEHGSLSILLKVGSMDVFKPSAGAVAVFEEVMHSVMTTLSVAATSPFESAFKVQFSTSGLGLGGWRLGRWGSRANAVYVREVVSLAFTLGIHPHANWSNVREVMGLAFTFGVNPRANWSNSEAP